MDFFTLFQLLESGHSQPRFIMGFANAINAIFSNIDAFGNLSTTSLIPRIQLQFPYNVNTDEVNISTSGIGSVTHSVPFAVLNTGAQINSSALFSSKNNLHYKTGEGGLCLFTAVFTTGVSGSKQEVGLGDSTNALNFGYNGTTFSINRRSNSVDNYIPQSSWNKDKMDGTGYSGMTLIPTNGNVYKIQYQWLGFGQISFYIENPQTGSFVLVHTIQYANSNTITSVLNPSMPLYASVSNTSNNTSIVLKVPSMSAFVEGNLVNLGLLNSISNSKSGVTTELNILTIRNNTTFGGITNRKSVTPLFFSSTNTGNADCTYRLKFNATLGGTPSFTDISTNTSVVSYDTAGTTVSNGRLLSTFYAQGNTNAQIDLSNLPIVLNNSDLLTISATSSGAAIAPSVALTWTEQN